MGSSRATDREAGKGRVVGEQQCEGAGGRARGIREEARLHFDGELNAFCCNSSFRVQGGFIFLFFGRMVALVRKSAFIFYFYNDSNAKSGSR